MAKQMTETQRLKVPPYSQEAEQGLLGCVLYDGQALDAVTTLVAPGDFYDPGHGLIYGAARSLAAAGTPIDVITVFEFLQRTGQDEAVGGIKYINELCQGVANAARVAAYAQIVAEKSTLRKLIAVGSEISEKAYAPHGEAAADVQAHAERLVLGVADASAKGKTAVCAMPELLVELADKIDAMASDPDALRGVPTGLTDLDRLLGGMQKTDLLVLAARPSMGKTALALNIAQHVGVTQALPTLVISLEMSAAQLALRLVGGVGRIDQTRLRSGKLLDEEWGRLTEAMQTLHGAPLKICETPALRVSDVAAVARRVARDCKGLGLVIVDYMQLMQGDGGQAQDTRNDVVSQISRGLKAMAKDLDCPVLVLSQLNRAVEARTDKRPMMSDLRESGAIEQDADVVMFIYRDDYYNKESREPGVAEVIVSKQRNGPTGAVKLTFLKHLTKFENLAHGGKP
jgi:replicative DNA helicase